MEINMMIIDNFDILITKDSYAYPKKEITFSNTQNLGGLD